jgi:ATP-dependent exoDNAse (exonuclease V) beta subunit
MSRVTDQAQRIQALDTERSFIVSAPAGSGKTGLITQRVLRLLCTVDNPEEILSITFTRKAAAEMASRVHSALQLAAYQPRPNDEYQAQTWDLARLAVTRDKALGWNLLALPGRLRIQTIDGFCRYIASQFALETDLGDLSEPSEHPQVHYAAAARSLLEKLEGDDTTAQCLEVLLSHIGNDLSRCETLLSEILYKREQWLPLIYEAAGNQVYFKEVIEGIVAETLFELSDTLMPIAGELINLVDFAASHLPPDKNLVLQGLAGIADFPDDDLAGVANWKTILRMLVTQKGEFRKSVTKNDGFPTEENATKARMKELLEWCSEQRGLVDSIANVLHLPDAEISRTQQALLDALGFLLPKLAAELNIQFRLHDLCDYSTITLSALQALEPSPEDAGISDITLRMDYQLRHILVDEFQDTSQTQIRLIKALISGWEPDDGRSLFLVGDAMQSLYSFRNANVGLFINSQRHPIGSVSCIPLVLTTNFRSNEGVVDWVNAVFQDAFPARPDISRGAIPYSPSIAYKEHEVGPAVSFQGFSGSGYENAEAEYIALKCREINDNHSGQSIAILVRSRSHLRAIIPAFRQMGLNWQAHDIMPLASRMPVVDLMSMTRALLSPADRIAWLSLLRAPFCGLGMSDLLVLTNSTQGNVYRGDPIIEQLRTIMSLDSFFELSDYGQASLKRIVPVLMNAWDNRGRHNFRSALENVWQQLGGPASLSGDADLSDVRSYLDLVERWQMAGAINDWPNFELAVDKLYAEPSPAVTDPEQQQNVIQVMTIHKSKGLEFDHVFLPGLTRRSASDKKPLLRWQEHIDSDSRSTLVMAPLGAYDEEDDPVYSYLKHESGVKSRLENTRVLYVAATRAIRGLYLFAELKSAKNGVWDAPSKNTLLAPIWLSINQGIDADLYRVMDTSVEDDLPHSQQRGATLEHIRRLPVNYEIPPAFSGAIETGVNETAPVPTNGPDAKLSRRARHLGTVMHRTLKQLANDGVHAWPESRLARLSSSWSAQLKELGIIVDKGELDELYGALQTMLKDPKGQWILGAHEQAQCEISLGYYRVDSHEAGTSVIDRTFVSEGTRWIVDYKFTAPNEGETVEAFEIRQISSYRKQLSHYVSLYRDLGPEPVSSALYFPKIGLFSEVSAD